jgi:lipopolysaccharide biosynthesis glycosyltransferase
MIHVACNIDSKYTKYCSVLMVSLFENNKDEKIKMHILGDYLTSLNKFDLTEIAHRYSNEIQFYEVPEDVFNGFPTSKQWPKVIYYRLMLPELIDKKVERVLYVDCDIIFRGSIKELFEINLKNNIIAAVEDVLSPYAPLIEELGYSPELYYFNSGVVLIDVPKWLNNDSTSKCIEFINSSNVTHPDQDALNAVFNGKWLRLHYRWNFLSNFHTNYIKKEHFYSDLTCKSRYSPIIIHFSGIKPWQNNCIDPFKIEYFNYLSMTKWKNEVPKHKIRDWIWFISTIIFDKIGIKKKNEYYKFFN